MLLHFQTSYTLATLKFPTVITCKVSRRVSISHRALRINILLYSYHNSHISYIPYKLKEPFNSIVTSNKTNTYTFFNFYLHRRIYGKEKYTIWQCTNTRQCRTRIVTAKRRFEFPANWGINSSENISFARRKKATVRYGPNFFSPALTFAIRLITCSLHRVMRANLHLPQFLCTASWDRFINFLFFLASYSFHSLSRQLDQPSK